MTVAQIARFGLLGFVLLALPVACTVLFYLLTDFHDPKQSTLPLDLRGLLASASWVQALVAWITLLVTLAAAYQIYLLRTQTQIQQELADREAYRRFITPQMQSAKRFARSEPVNACLKHLLRVLEDPDGRTDYHEMLEEVRAKIDEAGRSMIYPLMGRHPAFDDLESLLNEYNYVSKLIEDKRLSITHATDLGARNFEGIHRQLWPLISLRRKLSPGYAVHFTSYATSASVAEPRQHSHGVIGMNEQQKARFDALIELAKVTQPKWESRRQNEWRISFALWTLLVGATYYTPGKHAPAYAAAGLFALIVGLHAYILDRIRMRNRKDAWFTTHYLSEAEKVLGGASLVRTEGPYDADTAEWWRTLRGSYSFWFQFATTMVLAGTAFYFSRL